MRAKHSHTARLLSCALGLVGLYASATGCRQDPAFMEQAKGLTDEEIRARAAQQDGPDSSDDVVRESTDPEGVVVDVKQVINNTQIVVDGEDIRRPIKDGEVPGSGGGETGKEETGTTGSPTMGGTGTTANGGTSTAGGGSTTSGGGTSTSGGTSTAGGGTATGGGTSTAGGGTTTGGTTTGGGTSTAGGGTTTGGSASTGSGSSTDGGWNGTGQESPARPGGVVTTTIQTKQAKADILWVVDNSGSMGWAQSELTSRFTAYANKLNDMQVDFQLGVTSTEMCDINWTTGAPKPDEFCPISNDIQPGVKIDDKMVGPLRGELIGDSWTGKKVLLPGANFVSSFARLAKMGTNGSAVEHGLTAAKFAVQKAMNNGVNKGFLRNDAFLSVVVLSDEEDDGIQFSCEDAWGRTSLDANGNKDLTKCKAYGASPFVDAFGMTPYAITKKSNGLMYTNYKFTADNFVSFLNDPTVKGPGKFRVSAITSMKKANGSIDCSFSNGPLEAGTNYIKAAQLTGGVAANICSNDWTSVLADIGQNTAQLSAQVALPAGKIPFPGTLEVYVGGVMQGEDKYVYNEAGNYIEFLNPLKAGSQVKVVYRETIY